MNVTVLFSHGEPTRVLNDARGYYGKSETANIPSVLGRLSKVTVVYKNGQLITVCSSELYAANYIKEKHIHAAKVKVVPRDNHF